MNYSYKYILNPYQTHINPSKQFSPQIRLGIVNISIKTIAAKAINLIYFKLNKLLAAAINDVRSSMILQYINI